MTSQTEEETDCSPTSLSSTLSILVALTPPLPLPMMGSLNPRQVQGLGDEWRTNSEAEIVRRESQEGREKAGRGVRARYLGSRAVPIRTKAQSTQWGLVNPQTPPHSCREALLDPLRLTGPPAPGPKPCPTLSSTLLSQLLGRPRWGNPMQPLPKERSFTPVH